MPIIDTSFHDRYSGGPHGLGDPDDTHLRKVEKDVLIPKIMREKARQEKCVKEVEDFNKCCLDEGIAVVVKCRKENTGLKDCLTKWYHDEEFKQQCTEIYLRERSEYRRTGIGKKQKERQARIANVI